MPTALRARVAAVICALLGLALVLGCSSTTAGRPNGADPAGSPITIDPAAAISTTKAAAADDRFGGALFAQLPADGNLVYSPLSAATALQMALVGARGQTAAQLQHALALPDLTPSELASTAAVLRTALTALGTDENATVQRADALWPDHSLRVDTAFADALATGFGARPKALDFAGDPDGARRTINTAVSAATHGKIKELFAHGSIDRSTRLVLTDAVYLKARWAAPFEGGTKTKPFHRSDGTMSAVPTMNQQARLGYRAGSGYQAVTLPYAGDRLAMTLLLPTGSSPAALQALQHKVSIGGVAPLLPTGSAAVDLSMPKFTFRSALSLNKPLMSMGVTRAFGAGADFSGMSDESIGISQVVQQAYIAVDEHGTEAAAATGVVGATSAPRPDAHPVTMRLDHPFLFTITDRTTGAPLFLGRVADPTAK